MKTALSSKRYHPSKAIGSLSRAASANAFSVHGLCAILPSLSQEPVRVPNHARHQDQPGTLSATSPPEPDCHWESDENAFQAYVDSADDDL